MSAWVVTLGKFDKTEAWRSQQDSNLQPAE